MMRAEIVVASIEFNVLIIPATMTYFVVIWSMATKFMVLFTKSSYHNYFLVQAISNP
jgi:hypothetical protein